MSKFKPGDIVYPAYLWPGAIYDYFYIDSVDEYEYKIYVIYDKSISYQAMRFNIEYMDEYWKLVTDILRLEEPLKNPEDSEEILREEDNE